ncbi:hypothetical protein DFH07DRAFT_847945 [Mycena maculata]|uniref:Uncharacterized protein n=1 Tax=Mycena maculata TaxID=230809 RepID=A0AAD7HYD2_9AGAR|nr:hypothetical protein DFH07DRAFT_847945 [Mycena maculata]
MRPRPDYDKRAPESMRLPLGLLYSLASMSFVLRVFFQVNASVFLQEFLYLSLSFDLSLSFVSGTLYRAADSNWMCNKYVNKEVTS